MIFFGHRFIKNEYFYSVASQEAVLKTPPSSTIYIEFSEANLDIIEYTNLNNMPLALKVNTIRQALYGASFKAKYLVVEKDIAKDVQNVANEYLLDSKVLVIIQNEDEIEQMALLGIDGVIFAEAIVKTAGI